MIPNHQLKKRLNLSIIARLFSAWLLLPVGGFFILAFMTPITVSGALYLTGIGVVATGLWGLAWRSAQYRNFLWFGVGLIAIVAIVRLFLLNSDHRIKLLRLPEQNAHCWVNCLLDEQDVALFSTRVLSLMRWISPTEQAGLLDAMYANYQAMATDQPLVPSPFARTYLKQQRPEAFDGIIIEPSRNQLTQEGFIFLHGYAGNFTMPCWLLAQIIQERQAVTVCPSVGWQGDWWTVGGEATLRATLAYLHERRVSHIYLVGLSNGAVGASELAYKLSDELAGLILMSGASIEAKDAGLPVLVLVGNRDERMPADSMKVYTDRMGANATFVELQADHFMLAKNAEDVRSVISTWLRKH